MLPSGACRNGNVEKQRITEKVVAMDGKGIGRMDKHKQRHQ